MKYFKIALIISTLLLVGCVNQEEFVEDTYKNIANIENKLEVEIEQNKMKIELLQSQLSELQNTNVKLEQRIHEQEILHQESEQKLIKTMAIAENFVEAYLAKNTEEMKTLVNDHFRITENAIYYTFEDEEIELQIHDGTLNHRLNSYGVENNSVFYSYLLFEMPFRGSENGFYLDIRLELIGGLWQIAEINYDI